MAWSTTVRRRARACSSRTPYAFYGYGYGYGGGGIGGGAVGRVSGVSTVHARAAVRPRAVTAAPGIPGAANVALAFDKPLP